MADKSNLYKIVWAETRDLQAATTGGDLAVLQAAIAAVVAKKGEAQFPALADPPAADDAEAVTVWNAMDQGLKAATANPAPDPAVVLWEIDRDGNPVQRPDPLPVAARWILTNPPAAPQDFVSRKDPKGRRYRMFVKAATIDEVAFTSGFTGTGLPRVKVPVRPWYYNSDWWIGIAAAVLFFVAAGNVLWAGRALSQAADLLGGRERDAFVVFVKEALDDPASLPACTDPAPPGVATSPPAGACDLREAADLYIAAKKDLDEKKALAARQAADQAEPDKAGKAAIALADASVKAKRFEAEAIFGPYARSCLASLQVAAPARESSDAAAASATALQAYGACLGIWGRAVAFASKNLVFNTIGTGAISQGLSWGAGMLFGWTAVGVGSASVDLGTPLTFMMFGVILLLVALGRGFAGGKNLGALINAQGRYSLGLAQATFWTVLIMSGFIAISLFNAGLLAERMRDFIAAQIAASPDATIDYTRFSIVPTIPSEIWAVLGITLGSPLLSTLILRLKPKVAEGSADLDTLAPAASKPAGNAIAERRTNVRASIADWFLGEEGENYDRIDLSRVQMVLITAGLLVVYGHLLFTTLQDLSVADILRSLKNSWTLIPNLPAVSSTMAALLAISHSTYLVTKAAPVNKTSGGADATPP